MTKTKRPGSKPSTAANPSLPDQLRAALTELRLPEMREQLEAELASGPRDGDTRLEFLWRLVEHQLRHRRERSVQRRIDQGRLPPAKTLDDFDFLFQPVLDRERIMEFATLEFIQRGENILLGGGSGTGKSHIAIALGHLACRAGIRTRYATSASMLADLHASLATGTLPARMKHYTKPALLIIDEVGLDGPERAEARDAQLLYKVIAPRYDALSSTIVTSNIPWESWADYFRDDVATVALIDRLLHHGHVITIDGPSYRVRQHAQLNKRTLPGDDTQVGT